jgi:hypothetical protein
VNVDSLVSAGIDQIKTLLRSGSSQIGVSSSGDFNGDSLRQHNSYRAILGLSSVAYDGKLAAYAQKHAASMAAGSHPFAHSQGPYGENQSMSTGRDDKSLTGAECTKAWFLEFEMYNGEGIPYPPSKLFEKYGHFTQVMWPTTTRVGCASASGRRGTFVVCEYEPRGNVQGVKLLAQ